MRHLLTVCLWLSMALVMTGCEAYALRGTVIAGTTSSVMLVSDDDPRLQWNGLTDATLAFRLDPRSLGGRDLGQTTTRPDGSFKMPIDAFGAGLLEYELGIVARSPGYNTAHDMLPMPGHGQRLLIVLARGRDTYRPPADPLKDIDRFRSR